jgi:hypothetical protein
MNCARVVATGSQLAEGELGQWPNLTKWKTRTARAFRQKKSNSMGFRFRKRLKLFPGAWINLSKKGGSLSVGGHGATVNFSKRGVSETVGLPGSGISYRTKQVRLGQSRKVSHSHGQHHGAVVRPTGQRRRRPELNRIVRDTEAVRHAERANVAYAQGENHFVVAHPIPTGGTTRICV